MKNKQLKTYLKLGTLLFGIFTIVIACQKDDGLENLENSDELQNVISRKLSFQDIPHLNDVSTTINELSRNLNSNGIGLQRNLDTDSVSIVTDDILYITYSETHTYTFKLLRTNPEYYIENIVLHYNLDTGNYDEYLVQYDVSAEEYVDIANGEDLSESAHVYISELDSGTVGSILGRSNCTRTCQTQIARCTAGGGHYPGDPECCATTGECSADQGGYIYQNCGVTCTDGSPINTIDAGDSPGGGGGGSLDDDDVVTNPNTNEPCATNSGGIGISGSDGCNSFDDECEASNVVLNSQYSLVSPFNVNLSQINSCDDNIDTSLVEANQKFMCIYDKLTESQKFKDLFIDIFGESEVFDVQFKILDNIPNANGKCKFISGQINTSTGELLNLKLEIQIDKGYMSGSSAIAVAKTILHEAIHAYLTFKYYSCNQGAILGEMDDAEMSELLNEYYLECAPLQGEHEFMFNFLVPSMSEILEDLKDDLIPQNHQDAVSGNLFYNEENPTIDSSTGEYVKDVPWDWNEFYKYLSLAGLHESSAFHFAYPNNPPSIGYQNYTSYSNTGINSFRKECAD